MNGVSKDHLVYLSNFKEPHSSKRRKLYFHGQGRAVTSQPFLLGLFLRILDNRLLFFRSACHYSRKVAILTVAMVI